MQSLKSSQKLQNQKFNRSLLSKIRIEITQNKRSEGASPSFELKQDLLYLVVLMEQKYEQDLFKIIKLRNKRKNINQSNKVSLLISPQILQASQVIKSNQSQSSRRIHHKSASIKQKSVMIKRQKWQNSLNAYIQAKSKIHKKQKINNTINFFNLDRLNRNRYQQLISKQFASIKITRNLGPQIYHLSQRQPLSPKQKFQKQYRKLRLHSDRMMETGIHMDQTQKKYSRYGRLNLSFMKTYFKRKATRLQKIQKRNVQTLENQNMIKSCSVYSEN